MNINDVKDLKQYYEQTLATALIKLLGLNKEEDTISVNWTLERTNIKITTVSNNTVTIFDFNYDGTDFIISHSSRQVIMNGQVVSGVIAATSSISLNVIHSIFDVVVSVLNSSINEDNSEPDSDKGENN